MKQDTTDSQFAILAKCAFVLAGHRGGNQRVITRQQTGGTNAFDNLILLFFVADEVVIQDAANEPTIGATKFARVGPSAQHAEQ
jgi:hypothetical protein